ncbi:aldehyde dehydrogenase [Jejubacter calystegiae]|uniref:Aldehyde dehydrogenase n=1 Tax=Jejubacter calystegiae TaxID=2579935 RepID=A0A4P8YLG7_9ENTR|nr:aldehyde dehydrogenase family protein [Jejubacter calystegiae]QCT20484.1 aldehyde dehydrogenase [Jejubacter calystegiae]
MSDYRYVFHNFTAGQRQSAAGQLWHTHNPAHPGRAVGEYRFTAPEQLDEVVALARQAQRQWREVPQIQRVGQVQRFIDAIALRREEIARAIVLEQGKPWDEALGEVDKSCAEARMMAAFACSEQGRVMPTARPGFTNSIRWRPLGVVAAITPWNFPILTPMRKLAPALLFGNAIILKPSEYTPAAACLVAECARDILPDGLLQLIAGQGEVGAALVGHPGVDGVTFTGSVAVGRQIYQGAAQHLARVSLELGGKNAAIIHDTDDMDQTLDAISGAALACSGQRCTSISRVLVPAERENEVVAGLKARLQTLVAGDGLQQGVTLGPLIHDAHLQKVSAMVRQALDDGATLICGAEALSPPQAPEGFFYAPTLLTGVTPHMVIAREEIFGPVITVQRYSTFDEALAIVNDVEYGLTAALFSQDNQLIERFARECETGMLHINHGSVPDNHMPFGGVKHSGVGEHSVGPDAFRFYMTEHAVYNRFQSSGR